jgi:hypothetical protein
LSKFGVRYLASAGRLIVAATEWKIAAIQSEAVELLQIGASDNQALLALELAILIEKGAPSAAVQIRVLEEDISELGYVNGAFAGNSHRRSSPTDTTDNTLCTGRAAGEQNKATREQNLFHT